MNLTYSLVPQGITGGSRCNMIETEDISYVIELIVENVKKTLKKKDSVIMGFPGGRSIKHITDALSAEKRIDWKKTHIFMVDERLVDITDNESNYKLIYESLLKKLVFSGKLPKKNIHPFNLSDTEDLGVSNYQEEFRKFGGKFDIAFFGVGEDGHIGGLFPNLSITSDSNDNFIILHNSPKPPKDRMTLSKKCVLDSGLLVLLFIGDGKRRAYNLFMDKKTSIEECPAKLAYDAREAIIFKKL